MNVLRCTLFAVLLALVLEVGCGKKEGLKSQAKPETTPETELKEADKKPLTKEESAKVIKAAIRVSTGKPTGELTEAGLKKVKDLELRSNQLTSVKGLDKLTKLKVLSLTRNRLTDVSPLTKLTQLEELALVSNQLTDVSSLAKLSQLKELYLTGNPNLTKAQIAELQKALPECNIDSNPTKTPLLPQEPH